MTKPSVKVLTDLLVRLEAAEGADRELDALLCIHFQWVGAPARYVDGGAKMLAFIADHPNKGGCADHHGLPALTASLDASMALAERTGAAVGIDAAQMLHEALEAMANGGWRDDKPIAPQIANYLLCALVKAKIAQAESQTDKQDGKEG